jgi:hypothetical protein
MIRRIFLMIWLIVSFFFISGYQLEHLTFLSMPGRQIVKAQDTALKPPSIPFRKGRGGLYGRLTYNNLPVERARIILNTDPKALLNPKLASFYTDSNGYYSDPDLSPGTYYLAAGWPGEKGYWCVNRQSGELPTGTKITVQAGEYSQVPQLPLYVTIELKYPSDGLILSKNHPVFRWSGHEFLHNYELSLVRRDISSNLLKGEVILKRKIVKGAEFRMKKPLTLGIYWWTVSATDGEKTITGSKADGFAGTPVRLPGEKHPCPISIGNEFAVLPEKGKIDLRTKPTQKLVVMMRKSHRLISPDWNEPENLNDLLINYQKRGIRILVTSDNIWKLGGPKQAMNVVENLLKPYAEKYNIRIDTGVVSIKDVSRALKVGVGSCAFIWCSEHPWQPGTGSQLSDIKLLDLSEDTKSIAFDTYFYLRPTTIPVGTYVDQRKDFETVGIYR